MDVIIFYKKYIEPFTALAVLLMVCVLVFQLITYNNFQEQIANSCGWENEDTRCICQKGDVIAWENEAKRNVGDINLSMITIDSP